ncbi:E3 ubiquitin-protein ligase [Panicum miliaceum]|uniref:RING-type E3 ubiquitin transferase n=1 Tax=Panicum miliaceum TaxID=4540 RepID=A0A3L6QLD1_PANMI|nr:E3 ubiquitin-protein ligase [Panicum miliaceum]
MQKGEKKNMLKSYSALALCLHLIFQSVKLTLLCIIQHRQNPEEHEPLSSDFDGAPPTSAIVAVDTNLDTSTLDTYRAPPAPLPYDVGLTVAENPDLEKSDTKIKTEGQQSPKVGEFESCEKGTPEDKPDEEDVCPICLEEYDEENPRSMTKCEHHFHLCCILEWMERSDTCPVCDQITLIDEMYE